METELYKIRSVRACFRAAYDLFCSNLKTIFRKTWLPIALLSAVTCLNVLFYPLLMDTRTSAAPTLQQYLPKLAVPTGIALASLCISVWAGSIFWSMLNGQTRKANWPRMARLTGIYVGAGCVAAIVALLAGFTIMQTSAPQPAPQDNALFYKIMAVCIVSYIVWPVLLLPTAYSSIKYLMEPMQKAGSVLGKSYREGWRHWGFLFVCALLCLIIFALAGSIMQLPIGIMWVARVADSTGMFMGDASGLPHLFGTGQYTVATVCTFVTYYLTMWCTLVFYYAYGSIEAKIKAKAQTTL